MSRYIYIFIIIAISRLAHGQTTFQPKLDINGSKGVIYNNEQTIDLRLHTHGLSVGVMLGKIHTYYKSHYTYYSLGYVIDGREQTQSRYPRKIQQITSRSFSFGKQNHVINIRAGRGVRRLVSSESKRRGVSIGYSYQGGVSLALLNPVFLNLLYSDSDSPSAFKVREERYTEANAHLFTDRNKIYGGSAYTTGLKDLSIRPGVQGSIGAVFSFGNFDKYMKILEVGLMADVFVGKLPIMIETENISNKPYLFKIYASLQFGKRK